MKYKYLITVLLVSASALLSSYVGAAQYASPDGTVILKAEIIEISAAGVNAKGSVHLEATDKIAKTDMKADAKEIKVRFFETGKGLTGLDAVKSADIIGRMHLEYSTVDTEGNVLKSTADADNGVYSGVDKIMHLNGNINITHNNPAVFGAPATAKGDKAIINLTPNLPSDVAKFRIESTIEPSIIEFTPKKAVGEPK